MIILGAVIIAYLASILLFSIGYYFLYRASLKPRVLKRSRRISGLRHEFLAFYPSDMFKARASNEAINGLRLLDFLGEVKVDRWHSFDKGQMLAVSEMGADELAEQRLLDVSATELVEKIFTKYGSVELKPKDRRPFDSFKDVVIPAFDRLLLTTEKSGKMASEYNDMFSLEAVKLGRNVAVEVREVIPPDEFVALREITGRVKKIAEKYCPDSCKMEEFKEVFYSQVLFALSMNNGCYVDLDKNKPRVGYFDFLYLSSVIGTVNVASELTPARGMPRAMTSVQLLTSFLMLGVIVGAMVNAIAIFWT